MFKSIKMGFWQGRMFEAGERMWDFGRGLRI
ncbi:hypothetical protein MEC_01342 [Bartonella alsatica IBS 382]|uniref:Uncharacterized protein n=1 Tax=Bartonella alsatica IBS 382 TaxID=1094551 RepID=J1ISW2_9HYPH|nr:hypothetical protein MEC_01342 [Bartonella alsatica IBS 382]